VPRSCQPWEPDEVPLMAESIEQGGTTDVDGDGLADVCARGSAGFRCHASTGAGFGGTITGPALSDATGWQDRTNYSTIMMGDVTGDGLADVCARANAGIRCWPSTGTGFGDGIVGPELSDDSGWSDPRHYSTLRLADVDGDGTDDLCARAAAGFLCWRSTGAGFEEPWPTLAALSNAAGFNRPETYGTLRMGDVNGDGLMDVCARGSDGARCWLSTGVDFDPDPIAGPAWTDAAGWASHPYYSTMRLADVNADGRADLCARGASGFECRLSTGSGFGDPIVIEGLADSHGWGDLSNYATLRLADIDGDRDLDLCARANRGVVCWPFEDGVFAPSFNGPALSDDDGWGASIYYRTIRFADLDGDGDDDLCARASAGLSCWPAEPGGFGARFAGPEWSNDAGWWPLRHHSTIRFAGPRRAAIVPPPPGTTDAGPPATADAGPGGEWPEDGGGLGADAGAIPTRPLGAGPGDSMDGGCACTSPGPVTAGPSPLAWLVLLGFLVRRRRRPVR